MDKMTICRQCYLLDGTSHDVVYNEVLRTWACGYCGFIDETLTNRSQFVSVSTQVGSIMDEESRLQVREYMDRIQAKFKDEVEAIFDFYLGIRSPHTSLLGRSGAGLKNGAKQWFERIREMEKQYHNRTNMNSRAQNRRTKYMVAIAIKLAAQESSMIVLHNKMQAAGINRKKRDLPMYTKGDEKVRNPTLHEMFYRANTLPEDSFGHLDNFQYFYQMFTRYSKLLNFTISDLESTLLYVVQITNRMRFLAELPHEERLKHLQTKPRTTKHTERQWVESDFADLDAIDWDQVLPHAYQLYRMQECVRLWENQPTPMIAIALTQWGIQSCSQMILGQYTAFQMELASEFGRTEWTAAERFREMRNMIIAWSTTLSEAGVPFPVMNLPSKGGFGDGVSGYKGDARRPIPEIDLAVTAAPSLVEHWPKVLKARLRNRINVMDLDDEIWLCRKMYVVSAQVHHYQQNPMAQQSRYQVIARPLNAPQGPKPKQKPRASYKFRDNAIAARYAMAAFEPLHRARVRPPPVRPWTPNGVIPQQQDLRSPVPMYPTSQSILSASHSKPYYHTPATQFAPPPEEKSLQRMIEDSDSSSDEDNGYSSDEDVSVRVGSHPAAFPPSLAQINANAQAAIKNKQPFAFTIGPTGFNIDNDSPAPTPITYQSINHPHNGIDSSSDLSQTPVLMSRQSSMESSSGMGSASEAETVIRHPHGRLTVASMLNTPSVRTDASPSPSPTISHLIPPRQTPSTSTRGSAYASSSRTLSPAPSSSNAIQGNPVHVEDDHVGLLVRERAEYVIFRAATLEREGILVPAQCESYMWKWIRTQVKNGTMPKRFTPGHLRLIGIFGDPRQMDLAGWIESKKQIWSPVECLLRAGFLPQEIPVQYIPYSILHTKLLLNHYRGPSPLAPMGQKIDLGQLNQELEWLCNEDSGETFSTVFTTARESHLRGIRFDKGGAWDEVVPRKRRRTTVDNIRRSEGVSERGTPLLDIHDEWKEDDNEWDEDFDNANNEDNEYADTFQTPNLTRLTENLSSIANENGSSEKRNSAEYIPQATKDVTNLRNALLATSGKRKEFVGIKALLLKKNKASISTNKDYTPGGKEQETELEEEEDLDLAGDWGAMIGLNFVEMGLSEELGGGFGHEDDEGEQGAQTPLSAISGRGKRKRGDTDSDLGTIKAVPKPRVKKVNTPKSSTPGKRNASSVVGDGPNQGSNNMKARMTVSNHLVEMRPQMGMQVGVVDSNQVGGG